MRFSARLDAAGRMCIETCLCETCSCQVRLGDYENPQQVAGLTAPTGPRVEVSNMPSPTPACARCGTRRGEVPAALDDAAELGAPVADTKPIDPPPPVAAPMPAEPPTIAAAPAPTAATVDVAAEPDPVL